MMPYSPNGQDPTLTAQTLQKFTAEFVHLLTGKALLIFPSIWQVLEFDESGEPGISRTGINPTHIPYPDVHASTVGIYIPPAYPGDEIQDTLAEASRLAFSRILFLGSFVPINQKAEFITNTSFRLSQSKLIEIEGEQSILSVFDF